jgi:RNA polymerase sigma factor (sigma-70 family)
MKARALNLIDDLGSPDGMTLFALAPPAVDCSDPKTVRRLYETTGRAALSKTEHFVGRFDVAQEIVQEVFLKLWQGKHRFPTEKQAYYWVYKSCHNAGIDHLRSAAVRLERGAPGGEGEMSLDEILPAEGKPDLADLTLKRQLVTKALAYLDEREAQILGLWVLDGMTQDEIADLLDCSRKTVNRVVQRIEEKLSVLKERGGKGS